MQVNGFPTWDGKWANKTRSREFFGLNLQFKPHAIYVVGEDAPNPNPVKIGITSDIVTRFAHYRAANWSPVRLHRLFFCANSALAFRFEKQTHKALAKIGKHSHCEWFCVSPDDAEKEIRKIAARMNAWLMTQPELESYYLETLELNKKGAAPEWADPNTQFDPWQFLWGVQ